MTLDELIDTLIELKEYHDGGDFKVKGAVQPNYPMTTNIENICVDPNKQRVYIAMSDNMGYNCPRNAWTDDEIVEGYDD